MDSKRLAGIFKALSSHVSRGDYRTHLECVHATDAHTLDATDGHRLLRVTIPAGHGLPVGFYDAKDAQAKIKAGVAPVLAPDMDGYTYPDLTTVIPRIDDGATVEAASRVALNARYLADAMDALALATGEKNVNAHWRMPGNPLDPIRIDAKGDDASAISVIMPVRA